MLTGGVVMIIAFSVAFANVLIESSVPSGVSSIIIALFILQDMEISLVVVLTPSDIQSTVSLIGGSHDDNRDTSFS